MLFCENVLNFFILLFYYLYLSITWKRAFVALFFGWILVRSCWPFLLLLFRWGRYPPSTVFSNTTARRGESSELREIMRSKLIK